MKQKMNKWIVALGALFFPLLALADVSALNFTPPPSDYSVQFLSNLFGLVDGVLHGTGSQIMGAIFTVFNAAVLALGGIVIMYTLLVGTMNTAHEGEMLGKKWSSIWIPIRSTGGLALLIPKASGYCLMQIFVMWVVVQGVGAADKVWNGALDYLNKGGVIIKANLTPTTASTATAGTTEVAIGAAAMLEGAVCMLGLQKQLEAQRTAYLTQAAGTCMPNSNGGPCTQIPPGGPCAKGSSSSPAALDLCNTPVPDFLATFDAVAVQAADVSTSADSGDHCSEPLKKKREKPSLHTIDMPSLKDDAVYGYLNGICGKIQWKSMVPIEAPCS